MKLNIFSYIILFFSISLGGCANTAKYLRSEPSTHFPAGTSLNLPENISPYLKLHCIKAEEIKYEGEETANSTNSQCLYVSADVSKLSSSPPDPTIRNQIISTLVSISDMNCSTFLHRAFANRSGFEYGKKLFQDIATATSAGTATIAAPFSAVLGGGEPRCRKEC